MARRFYALIKLGLDVLPQRIPERADDHAPANRRIVGQLGLIDDIEIPLSVVFIAWSDSFFGHWGPLDVIDWMRFYRQTAEIRPNERADTRTIDRYGVDLR